MAGRNGNTAVFLSYATEDDEIVQSFFEGLSMRNSSTANIDIFFDRDTLHAGDSLTDSIMDGLRRSNYLFIFLLGTLKESHGWTGVEVGFYQGLIEAEKSRRKSTKREIIPIFLEKKPGMFADTLGIDLLLDSTEISLPLNKFLRRCGGKNKNQAAMLSSQLEMLFNKIAAEAESSKRGNRNATPDPTKQDEIAAARRALVKDSIVPNIMRADYNLLRSRVTARKIEQYFVKFEFPYDVAKSAIIQDETRLLPHGDGLSVFGLPGISKPINWGEFRRSLIEDFPKFAAEIISSIDRCISSAVDPGEELDNEQIFRSPKDNRVYRMIVTRQYTYYDGRITVHMYIIDILRLLFATKKNETETILAFLNISLKFRGLFLDRAATFSLSAFSLLKNSAEVKNLIRRFLQQLLIIEEEARIFSLGELDKIVQYLGPISDVTLGKNTADWTSLRQEVDDVSRKVLLCSDEESYQTEYKLWKETVAKFVDVADKMNRELASHAFKQLSMFFDKATP